MGANWRLALAVRRVLLPAAAVSVAAGLGLFGYTGYQVWDPGARQAQNQLIGRLQWQWAQHPAAVRASAAGGSAPGGAGLGGGPGSGAARGRRRLGRSCW